MSDIEADDYECPHCCGTGEVQCVNLGPDGFSESLPCPTCVSREYEGYRSPAEVAEIAAAAQAEAFERAARVAMDRHIYWRLPHPDDAKQDEVCDDISACKDISNAIRALTPSSGPRQRVPEGSVVWPIEPSQEIRGAVSKVVAIWEGDEHARFVAEELVIRCMRAAARAMLAEVKP